MMNTMIKMNRNGNVAWLTAPKSCAKAVAEDFIRISNNTITAELYEVGKTPFENLPEEIQAEVKQTLKAFNRVTVYYGNGAWHTECGCSIKAKYPEDHFVAGDYKVEEIYTMEERRQNSIEEYGYILSFLK